MIRPLGHNKRHEAHYDRLNDQRIAQAEPTPLTLPMQAYGREPVQWVKGEAKPPVWAWISWPHKPAERVPAFAVGWNTLVVVVEWHTVTGTRNTVVWRNAVTRRG